MSEMFFDTFIAESNKSITFTFDMTSHASRRIAHPGRSSSFYIIALIGLADKTDYTKRLLPLVEQVTRLKQRGLFSMMKTQRFLIAWL